MNRREGKKRLSKNLLQMKVGLLTEFESRKTGAAILLGYYLDVFLDTSQLKVGRS